jgi:hypothetical protein
MKPTTIPHTKRQRVLNGAGLVLERAYIFLPEDSWAALKRLSLASHKSSSQVIEALISIASRGNPVKDTNEQTSNRTI